MCRPGLSILVAFSCIVSVGTGRAATPDIDVSPLMPVQTETHTTADLRSEIGFCAGIPEMGSRIKCFEDIAVGLGIPVTPATGVARAGVNSTAWASQSSAATDGAVTATIALAASAVTSAEAALNDQQAALYVRCQRGQSSLYVNFALPLTPKQAQISLTLDASKPETYTWIPSKSGASLGIWDSDLAAKTAKWMSQGSRLTVKVSLPDNRSVTAMFNVADMPQALAPVRSACGW